MVAATTLTLAGLLLAASNTAAGAATLDSASRSAIVLSGSSHSALPDLHTGWVLTDSGAARTLFHPNSVVRAFPLAL